MDTKFEGPLETARLQIIVKRTEYKVLFEENAAFAKTNERLAEISRATAREEAQAERAAAREALTTTAGGVGARRGSSSSGLRIKVAKMDPPHFSGKMKDYPSFKEDWLALVTPELEDHEQ